MEVRKYILKCEAWVAPGRCPYEGQYLEWFDANAPTTSDIGGWTTDLEKALLFDSPSAALDFWRTPRTIDQTIRPDGNLNRPLTAFTVSVLPIGVEQ